MSKIIKTLVLGSLCLSLQAYAGGPNTGSGGVNGLMPNGMGINGLILNGIVDPNGLILNGATLNGLDINGIRDPNGLILNGASLNGLMNGLSVPSSNVDTQCQTRCRFVDLPSVSASQPLGQ
ncbi:MAG: hypothetical protein QM776_08050 [Rhodocyclaceae bacterium]